MSGELDRLGGRIGIHAVVNDRTGKNRQINGEQEIWSDEESTHLFGLLSQGPVAFAPLNKDTR